MHYSAPTIVNLEITDNCNAKCRHCYNFWRSDNHLSKSLSKEEFDILLNQFIEYGILHVVLSGGEPFVNFEVLEYALLKLHESGISTSCNSNLMLANEERIERLASAGLDHILTSLNSADTETNDYMVGVKNSLDKIANGVLLCKKNGIRVSANMIINKINIDNIHDVGKLASNLGCQKLFGTRVVPSVTLNNAQHTEHYLDKIEAEMALEQMLRVKEDFGIMVGTLVSYPLCLIKDLEKYRDFVGRGCPGQSGHIISINSNGDCHACVHEEKSYGNIFQDGLKVCYDNMKFWHNGSYYYEECRSCDLLHLCNSGCRMCAKALTGSIKGKDNLMACPVKKMESSEFKDDFLSKIKKAIFHVPDRLRFREEDGFWILNIRWANSIRVPVSLGKFLKKQMKDKKSLIYNDFNISVEQVAHLFLKDVIETSDIILDDELKYKGLSGGDLV